MAIVRRRWGYKNYAVSTGVSFGAALAMILSYGQNSSVFLAIIHGIMSWFYVIYFIVVYRIFS